MAVVLALRYFRVYLLGLTFKVVANCNSLRATFLKKNLLPRVKLWWLDVQEFTFDIRAGTRMALSKNPLPILNFAYVNITEVDWIMAAQLQDEQLAHVRKILGTNDRNPKTKHYFEEYTLKDNKVYRRYLIKERHVWCRRTRASRYVVSTTTTQDNWAQRRHWSA